MSHQPAKSPASLRAYRILMAAASPAAPLLLAWRARRGKEDPARHGERLGRASARRPAGPLAWFHAASVGETNAVMPLISALRDARPDISVLLTTGTVTSARLAASQARKEIIHQYVPLDTPGFARQFIAHWRPDIALFAESEIWPNLIAETAARGTPLVLVNGRVSDRSYANWRRRPATAKSLFSQFDLVLAQNERYAECFSALGATHSLAVGNLKVDSPPPAAEARLLDKLKEATAGRTIFLAASTHQGEEAVVAEAHSALERDIPNLLTIIVPRHPQRGGDVTAQMEAAGLRVARRTGNAELTSNTQIYVADTIGELGLFYTLSTVAFIGGSLVPHGGQNPVEAIKLGTAIVSGPKTGNFADAYNALVSRGGCDVIQDSGELAARVKALLQDPKAHARMLKAGAAAVDDLSGALKKTLDALDEKLPPSGRAGRAR